MSGFFALLFVIALIAMIVFMVQLVRRRPGAGRKIWQSGLAAIVFMGLSMATETSDERQASRNRDMIEAQKKVDAQAQLSEDQEAPTWDASMAQRVAALTTGEGLSCIPASTGKSCGDTVEGIGSVSLALSEGRITLLISDPMIKDNQFSPNLETIPRQNIQIEHGPLAGYYIARIETNTSAQYNIRNEVAHAMYGN